MNLVSVIILCYNKEQFIEETIRSVCSQTYCNLEILVINDGSTDNSFEVITSFDDNRIRYFNLKNGGASKARNYGLSIAKGDLIALLDGDDVWEVSKIAEQVKFIIENKLDFCFCNYSTVDINGEVNATFPKVDFFDFEISKLKDEIVRRNVVLGSASSVVFKREIITKIGYFNENLIWGDDWEYWIRVIFHTNSIGFLNQNLVKIRFGISQIQSNLPNFVRLQNTIWILENTLEEYFLSKFQISQVLNQIVKTHYLYSSTFEVFFESYKKSVRFNLVNLFRFDLIFLLTKKIFKYLFSL